MIPILTTMLTFYIGDFIQHF